MKVKFDSILGKLREKDEIGSDGGGSVTFTSTITVTSTYSASGTTADIHNITLTVGTACVLTVGDVSQGKSVIVVVNNGSAGSLSFAGTDLVLATETGVYALVFANFNGTIVRAINKVEVV